MLFEEAYFSGNTTVGCNVFKAFFLWQFESILYPDKIELVLVYKHDTTDEEYFSEKVYAERQGECYRVASIPAFAQNLAYGDLVKVEFDDGEYHFDELIEESGHSVIHIVIFKAESKEHVITNLIDLNCGVNTHVAENYLVVDIPPLVGYEKIREFLFNEKQAGNIDFRESCLSGVHTSTSN